MRACGEIQKQQLPGAFLKLQLSSQSVTAFTLLGAVNASCVSGNVPS